MKSEDSTSSAKYWDCVAETGKPEVTNELWRKHADFLNTRLLDRFLPVSGDFEHALKTDLFDESLGQGLFPALSLRSKAVSGLDISINVVRYARVRHNGCLGINADILDRPFSEQSFDLIVSTSTLDHFSSDGDIAAALDTLAKMLKPGGHLIWTMDNPANPVVWLRNTLSRRFGAMGSLVPYQMGRTWSLKRMARSAGRIGLEVQESCRMMHCPRALVIQYLKLLKRLRKDTSGTNSLNLLRALETLESLPTSRFTGYYNVIHATRRT